MKSLLGIGIALLSTLTACAPTDREGGPGGDDDPGEDPINNPGEVRHCNKMDLVFVIDDSASMGEEQGNLATNFPLFADVLSAFTTPDGEHIDYRVAVTTTGRTQTTTLPVIGKQTEIGDNGAFRNSCGNTKRYLEPSDANMSATLSCRADVGVEGPSTAEMPLMMSKWALSDRLMDGTNGGFLRDDALLAIVYLTDEDDLSTTTDNWVITATGGGLPKPNWHPADQVQFLDALKGHRTRWAASVIAGETDCESAFGKAANAKRLKEFVNLANGSGTTQAVFSSICSGDLAGSLQATLATFQSACGVIIL
jgi:hypothetical protein